MHLPAHRVEYVAARGLGCFRDGERIRLAATAAWKDASLSLGGVNRIVLNSPRSAGITELIRTARTTRAYGDVASVAMLLDGVADAWIEMGVQLWDLAATRILVEEAGGRFTDLDGRPDHTRGECVASNGVLHAHVIAALRTG
jgi:histidinol-phosphatase